jgi:hypothetical protein
MGTAGSRFRDPGHGLGHFGHDILVHCPGGSHPAAVIADPNIDDPYTAQLTRRLSCTQCAHTATWNAPRHGSGHLLPHLSGPNDPYFGLPLWLRTEIRRHILWAYNARHLTLLENYLGAALRERAPGFSCCEMTMLEELPAWMKTAKNRDSLLAATRELRKRAP